MADRPADDGLIREIEEDLREEKLTRAWREYGSWIIAACIALVVGVAMGEGWQAYREGVRADAGDRLFTALQLAEEDPDGAVEQLNALSDDAPDGVRLLARFRAAALAAETSGPSAAADAFRQLADDSGENPLYRDLAVLTAAMNGMSEVAAPADAEALIERLKPLAGGDSPWRFTAQELIAHLELRAGNAARAEELFRALEEDPLSPSGVRTRVRDMLAALSP